MQNDLRPDRDSRIDGHLDIDGPRGRLTPAGSGRTIVGAAEPLGSGAALEFSDGSRRAGRIGRRR